MVAAVPKISKKESQTSICPMVPCSTAASCSLVSLRSPEYTLSTPGNFITSCTMQPRVASIATRQCLSSASRSQRACLCARHSDHTYVSSTIEESLVLLSKFCNELVCEADPRITGRYQQSHKYLFLAITNPSGSSEGGIRRKKRGRRNKVHTSRKPEMVRGSKPVSPDQVPITNKTHQDHCHSF